MKPSSKKPKISILIPALNEEKNIAKIVKDCLRLKQYELQVLVAVDGKTSDNTEVVAKKAGASVVRIKKTGGKGMTFKHAIPHLKGDYIVQIDADYQFLPKEIPKLITPLLLGYDLALGTRYQKGSRVEKNSVSFLKLIGSHVLSFLTSYFSHQRITDVMAGFKTINRIVLNDIHIQTPHFGYEAELVIKAARKKYKIINVPITYKKRITGASNVQIIKHVILTFLSILKFGFYY